MQPLGPRGTIAALFTLFFSPLSCYSTTMRGTFPAVLAIVALLSMPGAAFAFVFEGPFQVKNQFPVFLSLNQPYLEKAATENSLSVSLSHSSVFVMEDSANWNAHLDLEWTELNIRYKKDLPGLFEIGVDVPVERATAGFMDRPLAWYHRAFHFGDYGRSSRPRNDFLYDIRKDGVPLIEGDNDRTAFGDVRVTAKRKIVEGPVALSALADVELPTGNARVGYGNGSTDVGIALLLDADLSDDLRLFANAGAVRPGELKALQTVNLRDFFYGGAALEYRIFQYVSLLGQLMVQTSPYPETDIRQIDNTGMLLVVGGRYYARSGSYELSLTEDPNTSGAPDFILNLTYRMRF